MPGLVSWHQGRFWPRERDLWARNLVIVLLGFAFDFESLGKARSASVFSAILVVTVSPGLAVHLAGSFASVSFVSPVSRVHRTA